MNDHNLQLQSFAKMQLMFSVYRQIHYWVSFASYEAKTLENDNEPVC